MDSIKQGANFVGEKVQEATSGASKEANKNVAKDSNAPIGTRYVYSTPTSPFKHIAYMSEQCLRCQGCPG